MWGARITGILTSVCNHLLRFFANIPLIGKGQSPPRACGNLAFRRVARNLLVGLLIVGSIGYTSLPALSATSIPPFPSVQGDNSRVSTLGGANRGRCPAKHLLATATIVLPPG